MWYGEQKRVGVPAALSAAVEVERPAAL